VTRFLVTLEDCYDPAALEDEWRTLEASCEASFFQSWNWVGSMLGSVPESRRPRILRVQRDGRTRALALLGRSLQKRHGFVRSRCLHLNETGAPEFDVVTVEHNGLLVQRDEEAESIDAVLGALRGQAWDELHLGGLVTARREPWEAAARRQGWRLHDHWAKPFHWIDLDPLRSEKRDYLDLLGGNTRYQLRRAMKVAESQGPLRADLASHPDEALEWLDALASLHQDHWTARGQPGAFATPFQRAFHAQLIRRAWPTRGVEIVRVSAGPAVLGYLYNFQRGGAVLQYQSGHVASEDAKAKPGLVCHVVAVRDALARGHRTYDLLMGGSHYKRTLTELEAPMYWSVVQRRRLSLAVESGLRDLRNWWRARSGEQH
jgi:CelD/BcsL family acetyltransferase involved in cellulose biosynthesis